MEYNVSRAYGAPLHRQVEFVIRSGIVTGRYPSGEKLPTEPELCEMFSVSRITIRRAMDALENEGLIERKQGRGTIVRYHQHASHSSARLSGGFLRHLSAVVAKTVPVVLDFGVVAAAPDVRQALDLSAQDTALRIIRVRLRDSLPFLHTTIYVGADLASTLKREDFVSQTAASLLIQSGFEYHHVSYSAAATLADPIIASQLDVQVGSPLLDLQRISRGQTGEPFEYMKLLAPPERFRFEVVLEHDPTGELKLVSGP